MVSIKAFVRTKRKSGYVYIRYRLSDRKSRGQYLQLFYKSDIVIDINQWDAKRERTKANPTLNAPEIDLAISARKSFLFQVYNNYEDKYQLNSHIFQAAINEKMHKNQPKKDRTLTDYFKEYLEACTMAVGTRRQCNIVLSDILNYQNYIHHTLYLDNTDAGEIENLHIYLSKHRCLGENTVTKRISRIRTFFNWVVSQKYTENYPFARVKSDSHNFHVATELYGTPVYLTIEERDRLYQHDFSARPRLAIQRDIFVLQCCLGCRVGDYYHLTIDNIVKSDEFPHGALEYIPEKTSHANVDTVTVPLMSLAREIIDKYPHEKEKPLMPFISTARYNDAIRKAIRLAGITSKAPVRNRATGNLEMKPIYSVASSHMARRVFVGNLYSKIKDPNIISKMSGHVEGSKAFARYRAIDAKILKETIKLLE